MSAVCLFTSVHMVYACALCGAGDPRRAEGRADVPAAQVPAAGAQARHAVPEQSAPGTAHAAHPLVHPGAQDPHQRAHRQLPEAALLVRRRDRGQGARSTPTHSLILLRRPCQVLY